jgi:DsbC/DsbD-like thiol-disulfide interchange protein
MIALRIMRLNGGWETYWKNLKAAPPKPANSNGPKIEKRNAA